MKTLLLLLFNLLTISQTHLVQRISGGRVAKLHEFPNLVALVAHDGDPRNFKVFCSGFILNKDWVLSSGHCAETVHEIFHIRLVKVMAGIVNLRSWEPAAQIIDIILAIAHQARLEQKYQYDDVKENDDIGLIGLAKSLRINQWVKPFPFSNLTDLRSGKAFIAGWGILGNLITNSKTVDVLRTTEVNIIDQAKCRETLQDFFKASKKVFNEKYVHDKIICTSSATGKSACQGDSGGPVMIQKESNEFEVIGIISFMATPCELPNNPSLSTKVKCYFSWIDETIRNNSINIPATNSVVAY